LSRATPVLPTIDVSNPETWTPEPYEDWKQIKEDVGKNNLFKNAMWRVEALAFSFPEVLPAG
jgi:hypothetical protein